MRGHAGTSRPDSGSRPDYVRTALLLSVGLHAILVLLALLPGLAPLLLPPSPITFELLAPPKLALPPPAPPPKAPPEGRGTTPGDGPRPRPKAPAFVPPPTEHLGALGTDDASVLLVLRLAQLRSSPYRAAAAALLGAFPDTRILAAGVLPSGEALARLLIDEADALVVTTTDPRDLTQTALLVVHSPALDLPLRLRDRRAVPWDPRALVRLSPGVTAFAQEEARTRFWDRLVEEDGVAPLLRGQAALSAEIRQLHLLVRLSDGVPTPVALRLSVSAEAAPALRLLVEMEDEPQATALVEALPPLLARLRDRLRLLGLAPLLDGIKPTQRGREVEIRRRLPAAETALLLGLVQLRLQLLPLPLEVLPPPDLGPAPLDGQGVQR